MFRWVFWDKYCKSFSIKTYQWRRRLKIFQQMFFFFFSSIAVARMYVQGRDASGRRGLLHSVVLWAACLSAKLIWCRVAWLISCAFGTPGIGEARKASRGLKTPSHTEDTCTVITSLYYIYRYILYYYRSPPAFIVSVRFMQKPEQRTERESSSRCAAEWRVLPGSTFSPAPSS